MTRMDSPMQSRPCSLTHDECQRQVQRILKSATFRNSATLQQLLQFLATKAFEPGAEALKEYTIGVEAFGRSEEFDPKTDTIVRVQIHRLRQKLAEYYESDGGRDPILIEIPKGHYLPTFEATVAADADSGHSARPMLYEVSSDAAHAVGQNIENAGAETKRSKRGTGWPVRRNMLIAAIVILGFAAGFLARDKLPGNRNAGEERAAGIPAGAGSAADPAKAFWSHFVGSDADPVIAYPDAVFLLDDWNDLFRYRRGASDDRGAIVDPHLAQQFASNPELVAKAGQLYYENGYTGAGELLGVATLSNLFGQMGVKPTIKPGRDVMPDDLRQHNVILVGSSFQNIAVAQLTTTADFNFDNPDQHHEQWRGQIINAHPRGNEASSYHTERDPLTHALKADYSLITVEPSVVPGRYIVILGGLDTTGTEGALLFATSRQGIGELSRALGSSNVFAKDEIPLFQALVRVQLERGYEVLGAHLVTVHRISTSVGRGGTGPASQDSSH